jgi:hypothetical protein
MTMERDRVAFLRGSVFAVFVSLIAILFSSPDEWNLRFPAVDALTILLAYVLVRQYGSPVSTFGAWLAYSVSVVPIWLPYLGGMVVYRILNEISWNPLQIRDPPLSGAVALMCAIASGVVIRIESSVSQKNHEERSAGIMDLGDPKAPTPVKYDFFLSHASEDKEAIARPLYEALTAAGVTVWFDEAVLKIGDSLRRKIDDGLARCNFGIVIISPSFLDKEWPQRELDGLVAVEVQSGRTKILPVWHLIDRETLVQRSPVLADRMAGKSSESLETLVQKILSVRD